MRRAEHEEEALGPLLRLAHEAGTGNAEGDAEAREKARFLDALAAREALPGARWRRRAVVLAAAALVVIAAIVAWPNPRLRYVVEGAVAAGGFVAPARGAPATLRFSDGSTVVLAGGARARVAEVTGRGARVVLEEGEAHVRVIHAPGTAWSIEAGPFSVAVTGTAFDVGFRAADQTLDVRMREGSVLVRGPQAEAGVALHAGQRLVAGSAEGTLRIEADATPASTAPPAVDAPAPVETPSAPPAPRERPSPSMASPSSTHAARGPEADPAPVPSATAAPAVTWAQRVAKGDFAGVIAEAEAKGVDATLASATLADLAALADAARYGGKLDLARRALGAERARFPGSREASNAAFLLGRIADDAQGSPAAAAALYDQYLAESPGGAFAEEALGRKMVALRKSSGREAARGAAAEYLRRYPGGAFAAAAREIAQDP